MTITGEQLPSEKIDDLRRIIAPVMRAKSQGDFKAIRFEIDVVDLTTAHVSKELEKYEALKDAVVEQIKELPLSINIVRKEKDYIESVCRTPWWHRFTYPDLDIMIDILGPLMRFKGEDIPRPGEEKLDLRDEVTEKKYVEFGPEHERLSVLKYREKVEAVIKEMVGVKLCSSKTTEGYRYH